MQTINITGTHAMTGESVTITAPVTGYHRQANAPVIILRQLTDDEWQALAAKLNNKKTLV